MINYVYEANGTWSLKIWKHKMTVLENAEMRRMLAPKRQEVTEGCRSKRNDKI